MGGGIWGEAVNGGMVLGGTTVQYDLHQNSAKINKFEKKSR